MRNVQCIILCSTTTSSVILIKDNRLDWKNIFKKKKNTIILHFNLSGRRERQPS